MIYAHGDSEASDDDLNIGISSSQPKGVVFIFAITLISRKLTWEMSTGNNLTKLHASRSSTLYILRKSWVICCHLTHSRFPN